MKKIKFIGLVAIVFLFAGCQKSWLDINNDPDQPTVAKVNLLLPSAEQSIAADLSMGFENLGYKAGVFTSQIVTRQNEDCYGITGADINYWSALYAGPIPDLDKIIKVGEEKDYMQYVGVAKILKAYTYSQMVDLWGSIPFSQADSAGITSPVFDHGKAIYTSLFKMINEGIADINNSASLNILKPSDNDLIYQGDMDKWVRAANTLKLKLYDQARLTSLYDAAAVKTLLAGKLIEQGGDFMMWFGTSQNPDNRNPGMADEYSGSQISTYISPWFFETLMGLNPKVLTGIKDPRIPYYWCNQSGGVTQNPPEYMYGNFVSIYFGSKGINRDQAGRSTFTMVGFYPVGGRYDDGKFTGQLGASDAAGDAPMRFITYPDRLFIEAELALEQGGSEADARTDFEGALNASFKLIDEIIKGSATNQKIPLLTGTTAVTDYVTAVMAAYDAASKDKKFELIMTEKWIQHWGSNIDSYTDYRRTGYPILFNPNTDPSNGGPDGSGVVPTSCSRGYAVAFPYPSGELDLNVNAPKQRNITTDKIFWEK